MHRHRRLTTAGMTIAGAMTGGMMTAGVTIVGVNLPTAITITGAKRLSLLSNVPCVTGLLTSGT